MHQQIASRPHACKLFDQSLTADKCCKRVLDHQETVLLRRENFGAKKLDPFRHFKISGGNTHIPIVESVFVRGVEKDLSTIQKLHMVALFEKQIGAEAPALAANSILVAVLETDVDALTNET